MSGSFPPGQELFLSPTEKRGAGKELSRQVWQGMVSPVPGKEAALSRLFAQDPEQIGSELRLWRLSRPCRSKTYRRRSAGQNKSARAAVGLCCAQLKSAGSNFGASLSWQVWESERGGFSWHLAWPQLMEGEQGQWCEGRWPPASPRAQPAVPSLFL